MSIPYPSTRPSTPMMTPVLIISFCSIIPVAAAIAFGGVEIGRTIPSDEPIATPMRRVETPPRGARLAETAAEAPTAARIGTRRDAVAVCEMKFAIA